MGGCQTDPLRQHRPARCRWPGGPVVRWPGGPVARWPGGPVVRWSGGPAVRRHATTKCRPTDPKSIEKPHVFSNISIKSR